MSAKKRKRLNHDDRTNILIYLGQGMSIPKIAARMGWAPSTIYREVNRNPQFKITYDLKKCKMRPGKYYVCNQCPKHNQCQLDKTYYNLNMAIDDSHSKRHTSHEGPRVTTDQLALVDRIVAQGTAQGLSLEYIYQFHSEIHFVSCITIRRWVNQGLLSTKRGKLRRARRYLDKYNYKRHKISSEYPKNALKAGRTYTDYLDYIDGKEDYILMELDSVEGSKKSKIRLFTIMFVNESFQIAKRYEISKASESVLLETKKIVNIMLEHASNKELILLSDNGVEFSQLPLVEELSERVKVFYTNPYKSTDKAHCERNHEYYRYVCPKGKCFDEWTQSEIDEIFSNINSYARKELKWKRPYDLFVEPYTIKAAEELGIKSVSPQQVNLASKF